MLLHNISSHNICTNGLCVPFCSDEFEPDLRTLPNKYSSISQQIDHSWPGTVFTYIPHFLPFLASLEKTEPYG